MKNIVKEISNEKEFYGAKITTGTYRTSDYREVKTYKTAKGLKAGLEKLNFPYSTVDTGDSWNFYGTRYTVSIMY